jgi:hypothetical protein
MGNSEGDLGIEHKAMAVPYETIKPEVERLRDFVTNDLDRLVSQDLGGNYLAAALITCACDAISFLKYGQRNRGDRVFAEILPDLWKPVAKTLYDAIRDGIVHVYDTKTIIVGSTHLNVVISWRAKPHLHVSATRTDVYVNIRQLSQDLKAAVAQFETDLKGEDNLRDIFYKSMRREREITPPPSEQHKWQDVLSRAPQETA